jgi:hypothetical protein
MSLATIFLNADQTINHLTTIVGGADIATQRRYAGFAAVSAITVYELALKEVFTNFSMRKHAAYGHFVQRFFYRINGRVSIREIREEYLPRFGERYKARFDRMLTAEDLSALQNNQGSVKSSYGNLVVWRNEFAHEGRVPTNATFAEVARSYELGKRVIECLERALVR